MAEAHTCEECGKRLATIGGLEIHMEMAHSRPAPVPEPSELDTLDPQPAMAVASPASPPMVPAPRPPRPPRKPVLGGIDPAEPLAWVLTVLLFLGGVVAAIHHPHPPSDVTAVVATSPVSASATGEVDEQNVLAQVDLQPEDLTADWRLQQARAATDAELHTLDPCVSPPVPGGIAAARFQDVDYKNGGGHLTIAVTSSSTAEITARRLAGTGSPQYLPCQIQGWEQVLRSGGATVSGTTVSPLQVALAVPGFAYQYVTRYTENGVNHTVTTDDFQLAVGRVKAHLGFTHCACTPYDVQADVAIVNTVAGKLQHLAVRA